MTVAELNTLKSGTKVKLTHPVTFFNNSEYTEELTFLKRQYNNDKQCYEYHFRKNEHGGVIYDDSQIENLASACLLYTSPSPRDS